ncbi:MAG: FAD-dependent oxidoreductase [Thermoanaerobaculia bacterium]
MADRDLSEGIAAEELREGEMLAGKVGEEDVLLARSGGKVYAVGATCTHYSAPLVDGMLVDGTVRCPWHHSCFDLATGGVLRAPALAPLPLWNVEERDGRIAVTGPAEAPRPVPAAGPESVVIIGAGAGGTNVADTLRREGYEGRILLVTGETDLPYDKPNLSKDYLAGHAPAEWLPLHPEEYYREQRIELRLGSRVTAIDTGAKQIATSSGERIPYGALVLATGASPRRLDIEGASRVQYLRTRADAERLAGEAAKPRRVAVIGASFIGLEVAASFRERGSEVTVIGPERTPLERPMGAEVGTRIRRIHEAHGVTFRLGTRPVRVDADGVVLDDGSKVDADLVVAGIGVTPDIELARTAGIATADGVLVNEYLQASAPDVWACGDIACWPDPRTAEPLRVEHWVLAGRHGQTVARNILGRREPFDGVPFFWSAHYDVVICFVGRAAGWDAVEIDGSLEANDATVVYRRGGEVVAVATIGRDLASLEAELSLEA